MKITFTAPRELVRDQLTSGIEHGIGYWCERVSGWKWFYNFTLADKIAVRVSAEKGDPKSGKTYRLDLRRALRLAAEKYPRLLDGDRHDAETGDVFIQLAAFGEIVYG